VLPPHNDTDLPIYGIDNVLFRPKANGECSSMRVREMLLGKVVASKPSKSDQPPGRVDLTRVRTMDSLACCVVLGGCDYFKTPGVSMPTAFKRFSECDFSLDAYAEKHLGVDLHPAFAAVSDEARAILAARDRGQALQNLK